MPFSWRSRNADLDRPGYHDLTRPRFYTELLGWDFDNPCGDGYLVAKKDGMPSRPR